MFVIHLMPKNTRTEEAEYNENYFRYAINSEFRREDIERSAWDYQKDTFYAENDKNADTIAKKLASMYPAREVCILKMVKSYTAVNPELVCKTNTEQGSFPIN